MPSSANVINSSNSPRTAAGVLITRTLGNYTNTEISTPYLYSWQTYQSQNGTISRRYMTTGETGTPVWSDWSRIGGEDYVVEEGTSYRKWASGKFEKWGDFDNPILTPTTAGTLFIGPEKEARFPRWFVGDSPLVTLEIITGSTIAWTQLRTKSIQGFYYMNCSPFKYSTSSIASRLGWTAIGRWK